MKRFVLVALALALVAVPVSCGFPDSPEQAARQWLQAFVSMDGNRLAELTCEAQQEELQQTALLLSAFSVLGQSLVDQEAKVDASGLRFTTVRNNGTEAYVHVKGQLRAAVLAVSQAQDVDQTWHMVREGGKWKWCGP